MFVPTPNDAAGLKRVALMGMSAYLKAAPVSRNTDLIRAEMISHLAPEVLDKDTTYISLLSSDVGVIKHLVYNRAPISAAGKAMCSSFHAYQILHNDTLDQERRLELFECLISAVPMPGKAGEAAMAYLARNTGDIALFDAVCRNAVHSTPTELVFHRWTKDKLEHVSTSETLWAELVHRCDISDPTIDRIATQALRGMRLREIALLLHIGVDFTSQAQKVIQEWGNRKDVPTWTHQLLERLTSNHGQLQLRALTQSLKAVFETPEQDLQVAFGGLSNRQKRAIKRKSKAAKMPYSLRRLQQLAGENL